MLKFLRQYNQWILAVGGTLLLITFLMPTAIQSCAQQSAVSGSTWATYEGGKTVTGADLENAQRELRVVELLGNPAFRQLGIDREPAHWWLAAHEAQHGGFVGGAGDGEAVLAAIAGTQNLRPEQVLAGFMDRAKANREVVLGALAKAQGIQRMLSLASNVDRMSDLRLRQTVARSLLAISGDIVVVDARSPGSSIEAPAPTDARLAEQLAKFADKSAPAVGQAGRDNFGYRIPDRVKLEWMQIPKSAVLAGLGDSPELATLALKKRFAQDPAKYGATPGASFATYESAVRAMTLEDLAAARLAEIGKFASDQLALAQRALRRNGAYLELPEDWNARTMSFASLAESISAEFGIATPVVQSSGPDWMKVSDVDAIAGLGTAATERFGTRLRTGALVAGAKELSAPKQTAPIQVGVAGPTLLGDAGDVYVFRILAAEPSRPAAELAEARAEVERDLASLERFAWLDANLDSVVRLAVDEGLSAVATRFGTEVRPLVEFSEANPQFLGFGMRLESPLPGLGTDSKTVAELVEKASRLPLTADVATLPAAERTFAALSADRLSLVVIRVDKVTPVTVERFAELRANPSILGVARDPKLAVDPADLFGYEVLAKRYDFKPSRGEDAEIGAEPVAPESAG